jgi:hypothetical protein
MDPITNNAVFDLRTGEDSCDACSDLRDAFTRPGFACEVELEVLQRNTCQKHEMFLRHIWANCCNRASAESNIHSGDKPKPYIMHLGRNCGEPHAYVSVDNASGFETMRMLLARAPGETQTPGYGRVLDPEWIDPKLIQEWKNRCLEQHGEKCHNPQKIKHISPSWLIDTYTNRLVPGEGILEFLALSYRWGITAGFRTSRRMLEDLQLPESLSQEAINGRIPLTIRHAMRLTQIIGERYLWVDAICIVQDDEIHMMKELEMMGTIYASAKLTIVASEGDAEDGIGGLKGISQPREFQQEVVPLFDREQIIFRKDTRLPI